MIFLMVSYQNIYSLSTFLHLRLSVCNAAVRMEGTWEVAHFLHFAVSGLLVFVGV